MLDLFRADKVGQTHVESRSSSRGDSRTPVRGELARIGTTPLIYRVRANHAHHVFLVFIMLRIRIAQRGAVGRTALVEMRHRCSNKVA